MISLVAILQKGPEGLHVSHLAAHSLFNNPDDFDIKASRVDSHKFPRMTVKHRDEIVALGKKFTKEEIEEAGNRM